MSASAMGARAAEPRTVLVQQLCVGFFVVAHVGVLKRHLLSRTRVRLAHGSARGATRGWCVCREEPLVFSVVRKICGLAAGSVLLALCED